ncbi:hypothetical protein EZV62_025718 [Acer yangbiense]|uniref:L-dopachrome isomerase n=1 Tax=Acer yangbiense TaxID=1000413 RepID=A0A5C7GYS0_9ROSI|nr:hypothetical protein EZV62_025718 [Acer yangbiense]
MPMLNVYTIVPVDAVIASNILRDATKAVVKIIGKPVSLSFIHMITDFPEGPAAYGELISIGGLSPTVNAKLSSFIADILRTKLSIDNSRTFVF